MTLKRHIALLGACALWPVTGFGQFTITGVTDKTTYADTATLTVNTQAGYTCSATLNNKPIAVGAPVVSTPDFYELRVNATNSGTLAVTSQYLRFIVFSSERGTPANSNTELGIPPHVPFPVI